MAAIYEPRGRAREYSSKALNIYLNCSHGCRYCYAPGAIRKNADDYFGKACPRSTVIADLERQLARETVDDQVLLSFVGDPYTASDDDNSATRRALEILLDHRVPAAILTKSGKAPLMDIDIYKRFGRSIMVGATLTFLDPAMSLEWEPGAALPEDRLEGLRILRSNGVKTFASFEPVIDPEQSLAVMERSLELDCIDLYKVGKLNGMPSIEKGIDWTDFLTRALDMLRGAGKEIYVKEDLRRAAPGVHVTPEEADADLHTVRWVESGQRSLSDFRVRGMGRNPFQTPCFFRIT